MSAEPKEVRTATLAALRQDAQPVETRLPQIRAGFDNLQGFELAQRAAKALAASTLVPQQFQANLPNCLIALEMAQRIGASPLLVMQNLYVVQGRPSWSAKFLIATFNQCGRFSSLRYEWTGTKGEKSWGCRAWAIEKATGDRIQGAWITWAMAEAEGWTKKSGSKWQTIPEQMFMYRAAAWLVNTHAPEISMGLSTAEEIGDVFDAQPGSDGSFAVTTESLRTAAADAAIPMFDAETAVNALAGAADVAALKAAWEEVRRDFADTGRELPVEVDAAYNERFEALADERKA